MQQRLLVLVYLKKGVSGHLRLLSKSLLKEDFSTPKLKSMRLDIEEFMHEYISLISVLCR
jgi:hypothetical protein